MSRHLTTVDRRPNGEYFITTFSYDNRTGIADGPPVVLSPNATPEQLGAETLAALLRSTTIVSPLKTGGPSPSKPLLDRAGVKTFGAYMKGTKSIQVWAEFEGETPEEIEFTPMDNEGARGGYSPIIEKITTARHPTDEALGDLVLRTLEEATV